MQQEVDDFRYRILVMLRKSDRLKYYDFYCPICTCKVCELNGTEIKAIDDATDVSNKRTVGVRCPGRYRGGHCNAWFYFEDMKESL